jgi:hypothetical protein
VSGILFAIPGSEPLSRAVHYPSTTARWAIHGSVIDVQFAGDLPGAHEALMVADGRRSFVEQLESLIATGVRF